MVCERPRRACARLGGVDVVVVRMAISHLCLTCGADLARERAEREPRYGLPLVICPWCGTATVRRRHPMQQQWRSMKRVSLSLVFLGVQASLFLALLASTLIVAWYFGHDRGAGVNMEDTGRQIVLGLSFGLLPISLGAWLTAGLHHWRTWAAWVTFGALALVLLSLDVLLWPAATKLARAFELSVHAEPYQREVWADRLWVLALVMTVAVAGIPLGRLMLAGARRLKRQSWRRRLRRMRARRAAG